MSIRANVDRAEFNARVTFSRETVTQNSDGDPVSAWASLGTVWARVDGTKAGERFQDPEVASGVHTVSSYTVWVRSEVFDRLGLTTKDRVTWKGKVMDILDIPDQQKIGRKIAIICRAGLNNG